MSRMKRDSIEEAIDEKYVGLAKEAATKAMPRADTDVSYFLHLAETESGKSISNSAVTEIWSLFQKSQPTRIKQVEAAIKRYEKGEDESARKQLEWYRKELVRLKDWKPPRK